MATSTVPAFKSALVTRLQADSDLTGVQITYGFPGPSGPDREWVWIGNATADQVTAAMGQRRREETWTQEVIVSVVKPLRETQQSVTERAFTIAGHIEDSLRDWSSLASPPVFGGVVREALVVGMSLEEFVSDKEREARITIRVACNQRI